MRCGLRLHFRLLTFIARRFPFLRFSRLSPRRAYCTCAPPFTFALTTACASPPGAQTPPRDGLDGSVGASGGDASTGTPAPGTDGAVSVTSGNDGAIGTSMTPDAAAHPDATATGDGGSLVALPPQSPFIVVDQFGYRPPAEKIAVVRNPKTGFDSATHFMPGAKYALVNADTGSTAFEAAPVAWNSGATDSSSGDQAWRFDFSSVTTPGDYFVLDEAQDVRSDVFRISSDVYAQVLKQSIRMLYYQRDGIAKDAQYAGAGWADGFAHPQDTQCVTYDTHSTPLDLHGGWFDAGDENRYSSWGAVDVIQLLRGYVETPGAFTDDYGIPESGNGVPDLLDETKWEIDWLLRMQGASGSLLSIAGHVGASPPSTDTSPCLYAPATTAASFSGAAVFAYASIVFQPFNPTYASQLKTAAINAWNWAVAHPGVTFHNAGTGVGAGDPELEPTYQLPMRQLEAALYLFEVTGQATYQQYFDANYATAHLISYGNYADMFEGESQETLLDYTKAPGATPAVVSAIKSAYQTGMQGKNSFAAQTGDQDPYLAFTYTLVWGSNAQRADQGTMFYDILSYGIDASENADAARYAERYIHYFHGTNPLDLVYLSNMGSFGASSSVTRFFHTWFAHGSPLWDEVGVSTYGPPPGYVPGGPNPSHGLDACCSASGVCQGPTPCPPVPTPPAGQPSQKSYAQFNDNWPVDSWQVTEPDDGYQANYIRLLSKFMK